MPIITSKPSRNGHAPPCTGNGFHPDLPRRIKSLGSLLRKVESVPLEWRIGGKGISLTNLISITPPGLGEAAYFGFIGEFIRAVAEFTEATDAGILAHLLPAIATMIGPGPHTWGGDEQPARINTAVVGPTSTGRKGTSRVPVNKLMGAVDAKFWDEQCVSGLSSGEGLIQKVSDRHYRDDEGEERTQAAEKRLYVVEPEFSKVLAHCRREGNILSQILRETFDSGNLSVLTRNPLHANKAHIAITAHITQEELAKRFSEIEMANGFGNRFLWFYVDSDKELPDAPPIPDTVIVKFAARLKKLLGFAQAQTRVLKDEEATDTWKSVYSYLRMSKPGLQGAMLARGESIVLRLALIYALLDQSTTIQRCHIEAGLAIWQYNEQSVRLIFSNKVGDSLQDKLYELLGHGPMTTKQFHDHMNKPAKDIRAALDYLQSIGRVKHTVVKPTGAGRPAMRWERVKE